MMYRVTVISVLSLLVIPNGNAAEWSLTSSLISSLEYDDNIFMREDKKGDYHASVAPALVVSRKQDDSTLSLRAGYVLDRYEASNNLDADNLFWRLNSQYQTERSQWQLGLRYAENTTRNEAADDTGDFETNAIVTRKSIEPSYSVELSDQDSLSLSASYSERGYSTEEFSDRKTTSLSSSWRRQFTERFNGGLSVSFSNIESNGVFQVTDDQYYDVGLSGEYELSEVLNINGSAGLRQLNGKQVDFTGAATEGKSNGELLELNISYNEELNSVDVGLSRELSPSSTGDINEVDRVSLILSRDLSEQLTASLHASYQVTRVASTDDSSERKNVSLSSSVNWKFSQEAELSLSYNYRQQQVTTLNTNANSNGIMLQLNYNWEGVRVSR